MKRSKAEILHEYGPYSGIDRVGGGWSGGAKVCVATSDAARVDAALARLK